MKTKFLGAAAALALMTSVSANAAIIVGTIETEIVPLQLTSFNDVPMTFNQFDPSLGTLLQVNITLEGNVQGSAAYESLDASPATITLNLQAIMNLTTPGGIANLASVLPVANVIEVASAFDGSNDFAGTSGSSFGPLNATDNDAQAIVNPFLLALFTGIGTIDLELDAIGASSGSGAGNLVTQFSTFADGTATVQYVYDDGEIEMSEPGMLALLGLGLIGMARIRRGRTA